MLLDKGLLIQMVVYGQAGYVVHLSTEVNSGLLLYTLHGKRKIVKVLAATRVSHSNIEILSYACYVGVKMMRKS